LIITLTNKDYLVTPISHLYKANPVLLHETQMEFTWQ